MDLTEGLLGSVCASPHCAMSVWSPALIELSPPVPAFQKLPGVKQLRQHIPSAHESGLGVCAIRMSPQPRVYLPAVHSGTYSHEWILTTSCDSDLQGKHVLGCEESRS